jgi:hypothetical protein
MWWKLKWRARNACIWKNKQVDPVITCVLASYLICDYNWCSNNLILSHSPTHEMTWLKCNVDGVLCRTKGKFGISICGARPLSWGRGVIFFIFPCL